MPSPFPGMDPYIEGQSWQSFHTLFIVELVEVLVADLRPRYVVDVEERIYVEHTPDRRDHLRPDVTIATSGQPRRQLAAGTAAVLDAPLTISLPVPEEVRERYLAIRPTGSDQVVTVIEVLSPANKRRGSAGREAYLEKRDEVLRTRSHLLEFDLLRGGDRLPVDGPQPGGDYLIVVSRSNTRPSAGAWPISIRDPLPQICVPLAIGDPDAQLDVKATFTRAFDRGGFDYKLHYDADPEPALSAADAEWARALLAERSQPAT